MIFADLRMERIMSCSISKAAEGSTGVFFAWDHVGQRWAFGDCGHHYGNMWWGCMAVGGG